MSIGIEKVISVLFIDHPQNGTEKGVKNLVIGYHDGQRWCCGMNSNVVYWQRLPEAPEEE